MFVQKSDMLNIGFKLLAYCIIGSRLILRILKINNNNKRIRLLNFKNNKKT